MTPPEIRKAQTKEDFYKDDFEDEEEIGYSIQSSKNYMTSTGQKVMVNLSPDAVQIPVIASKNNLF